MHVHNCFKINRFDIKGNSKYENTFLSHDHFGNNVQSAYTSAKCNTCSNSGTHHCLILPDFISKQNTHSLWVSLIKSRVDLTLIEEFI